MAARPMTDERGGDTEGRGGDKRRRLGRRVGIHRPSHNECKKMHRFSDSSIKKSARAAYRCMVGMSARTGVSRNSSMRGSVGLLLGSAGGSGQKVSGPSPGSRLAARRSADLTADGPTAGAVVWPALAGRSVRRVTQQTLASYWHIFRRVSYEPQARHISASEGFSDRKARPMAVSATMNSDATGCGSVRRRGRTLWSPLFVSCALVALTAGLTLRPGLRALAEHYRKESIAIRRPLAELDVSLLPSFRRAAGTVPASITAADLGTEEFIWLALSDESTNFERRTASLLVTYYNNPRDKVPHTPEVCYRQQGTDITGVTTDTLETLRLAPENPRIKIRVMRVHQPQPPAWGVLAYVFCANGEFCHDREQVRWIIDRPGDRYTYFSKIEASAHYLPDAGPGAGPGAGPEGMVEAMQRAKRLLSEVLPVLIDEHFPTGVQVSDR